MKLFDKLERKFGRYGISNLTMYIIVSYVIGYFIMMINPSLLYVLSLEPAYILHGQIWRLVTWIFYPPSVGSSPILFLMMIVFFYYPIGNSLERTWGTFRYTLYIFSGLIFTIIGAFILYFILGGNVLVGNLFTTSYISMSIFLAFAMSCPDMQLLLFFVIPIKMKWMAVFYVATIVYDVFSSVRQYGWFMMVPALASLLNFIIYYISLKDVGRYNPKEIRRKQEFRKAMEPQGRMKGNPDGITKHKCAICGRTEKDDPNLEFRFCSKCVGNYEYCQDHLFTHTHIK